MAEKQRQLKVSPTEGEQRLIEILAEGWGAGEGSIVMLGFRRSIGQLMTEFEQYQRLSGSDPNPLRLLLLRLASGEVISEMELSIIAHDAGVDVALLTQIRDCLINGGSTVAIETS